MLDMPGILPRLVHILRVINYGPNLAELINHNMAPQVPITSDILTFFSTTMGVSDWEHFDHLEQAVRQDPSAPGAGGEDAGSPRSARSSRCTYYSMCVARMHCTGALLVHLGSELFFTECPTMATNL